MQDRYDTVPESKVLASFGCHLKSTRSWQILPLSQVIVRRSAELHVHRAARLTRVSFPAEMAIHFPGLENVNKPTVWVFPEVLVCLDCGVSEFAVPETELCVLVTGEAEQGKEPPLESSKAHS